MASHWYFNIAIVVTLRTEFKNVKTEAYVLHFVMHNPNLLIREFYVPPSDSSTFPKKLDIILHSSSWYAQTDERGCLCLNRRSNKL